MTDDEFEVAVRKLIYRLADVDPNDPTDNPDIFEAVTRAEQRIADLEEAAEKAQAEAEVSKVSAQAVDDGRRADGSPSKIDTARMLSRDEAVRAALEDGGRVNTGGRVRAGQVQDMAKPQTNLQYRTIYDAWDQLVTRHDEFEVVEPDEAPKRLQVDADDLSQGLVGIVEDNSGRDGLSELLHRGSEG